MNLLFAFLTLVFIIVLFIGLFKPSIVVFWTIKKTRGKALLVYGLLAILCFLLWGAFTPNAKDTVLKEFTGEIVYDAEVRGDSSLAKSLADLGIPLRTIIQFGTKGFQCTEVGGLTDGTFFCDTLKYKSWFLDHNEKTAIQGTWSNIDENVTDALKQLLPYNYKTELVETNENEIICGYNTIKYQVKKSAYIRDNAKAYVWITKDLKLPLRRYDFQTNQKRMVTPLPLSIPNDIGAILKIEVEESGILVVYKANRVESKDLNKFEIPDDYTIINEN